MKHIFISPHIDDAFLSAGGLILSLINANQQVSIEYIYTRSNWTNQDCISGLIYESDDLTISNLRKKEEESINLHFDCKYAYNFYDYLDEPLRASCSHAEHSILRDQIQDEILEKITKEDLCYFPLGLFHNDHITIRNIGLNFLEMGYQIIFFEDMPYIASGRYNLTIIAKKSLESGLEPTYFSVNNELKETILKFYSSQVSYVWLNTIANYSYNPLDNKHYERFWSSKEISLKLTTSFSQLGFR